MNLSRRAMDLAYACDSLGGKCAMRAEGDPHDEPAFCEMPFIMLLYNADGLLSGCAQLLEYCVARPLYVLERKLGSSQPPHWLYSA